MTTRRELDAAATAIGKQLVEWALAVQRGDPDAATFLGKAKAAALSVARPELQALPPATSPARAAGGAR